jgi:hypothetical protein
VRAFLATEPAGGWLPKADVIALLRLYGISLVSGPTITSGTEAVISVKDDKMFGPLVVFGLSGVRDEALPDHAARLAPLTTADADMLINSIRSAPLLNNYLGAPGAEPAPAGAALRDALLRVSRLTEDLPEITELDLDPVIVGPDGAVAVDARIRVAPQVPQDPFLRKLRLRQCMSAGTASARGAEAQQLGLAGAGLRPGAGEGEDRDRGGRERRRRVGRRVGQAGGELGHAGVVPYHQRGPPVRRELAD